MQTKRKFHVKNTAEFPAGNTALLAMFLTAALIIGYIENMIPFDFAVPGVKLGLSNVVILTSIYVFGFRRSAVLVILKCVMLVLITGNVSAFLYSISGSLLSFTVMCTLVRLPVIKKCLSPIGVSAVGAVFHNIGQIMAAAFVLGTVNIVVYLPILLVSGVITGVIVGTAVKLVLPLAKKAYGAYIFCKTG